MHKLLKIFLVSVCLYNIFTKKKFTQSFSEQHKNTGKFKRCIFILLDGLRPDCYFECDKKGRYHNNFTNLKTSFDFISLCDSPTLTAPRMYSLFSGNKSCFVDSLFGFYHRKQQSNIFDELKVFYCGDETLKDIFGLQGETYNAYGNNFCMKKEYSSLLKMLNELKNKKIEEKSELMIGHFSAVDALGHKKGSIQHKEIQNVLKIYNSFLMNLTRYLDDNTFIVVTSDHGVRENGDHGNNSLEESTSFASFIFNKKNFDQINEKRIKNEEKIHEYYKLKKEYEVISQNDISNTIFSLLGVKYPKTSTGSLIGWMVNKKDYLNLIINKIGLLKNKKEMFRQLKKEKFIGKDLLKFIDSHVNKFLNENLNYLIIILCALTLFILAKESFYFNYVFLFFMICHSVYSFIHEDILLAPFLSKNFLLNFILLLISDTPQHKEDRWALLKVHSSFFSIFLIIFINFLPKFGKKLSFLNNLSVNFSVTKLDLNMLIILLRSILNLFNLDLGRETKIIYLIDSLDPMSFLYTFNKPIRCYFMYHLFNANLCNNIIYYYFSIFMMGINWSNIIDLNICYFFSDEFEFFTSFSIVFFTYCYPRLRLKIDYNFEIIHFLINLLVSLVTYDQMVFLWFFGGRTFYQGLWCILSILKNIFIK
ncbi:phosphatidylinositol class O [Tubulinosema ratisbonensis]|uniref:Phosphatidylinositol class O n=1 Tax=Tubulinosema ratisbonensis TaxID=291195 RepID=A0A437AP22_9MICR|nr:phosphatidylinositol class O [Tubulinosema ratisbonensis]